KTSLLVTYQGGRFPYSEIPELIDVYNTELWRGDTRIHLSLWDTDSSSAHDVMRSLAYPDADVIIICYSTIDNKSGYSVEKKWWPEVYYKSTAPIILVGTNIDRRINLAYDEPRFTTEQGSQLAARIGAKHFVECSALSQQGIEDVLNAA
ncbi:P-loop containing nucleoside triphosphate hydrolase protein, partial [Cercophora newfieldiana]